MSFATQGSPLFTEWLALVGDESAEPSAQEPVGEGDALVVIDMQNDFVPRDAKANPHGGRFGVAEGDHIIPGICSLITAALSNGATVTATRDYHPHDHVSFTSQGGPFPAHCVQGTAGALLLPQITSALFNGWRKRPESVMIAFKAFHEDVDSFGGLPYSRGGPERVARRAPGSEQEQACPMGCTACPWTGCIVAKQSALNAAASAGPYELASMTASVMNAPPDMLAMYEDGHVERGRRSLQDALKGSQRLFVCGLALDFCVLDTCLNARDLGFNQVFLVLDAARAAHISGVGAHGTGFLTPPSEVLSKLKEAGVGIVSLASACGEGQRTAEGRPRATQRPVPLMSGLGGDVLPFPARLGPIGLMRCARMPVSIDLAAHAYTVELVGNLAILEPMGVGNRGVCSPPGQLPPGWPGAPVAANRICWASPITGMGRLEHNAAANATAFLALSATDELRFAAHGGFLLLDEADHIVAIQVSGATARLGGGGGTVDFKPSEPLATADALLASLSSAGRVQRVMSPSVLNAGGRDFCWLAPGEDLLGVTDEAGTPAAPPPHGAFLYAMGGDAPPLLFELVDPKVREREEQTKAILSLQRWENNSRLRHTIGKVQTALQSGDLQGAQQAMGLQGEASVQAVNEDAVGTMVVKGGTQATAGQAKAGQAIAPKATPADPRSPPWSHHLSNVIATSAHRSQPGTPIATLAQNASAEVMRAYGAANEARDAAQRARRAAATAATSKVDDECAALRAELAERTMAMQALERTMHAKERTILLLRAKCAGIEVVAD